MSAKAKVSTLHSLFFSLTFLSTLSQKTANTLLSDVEVVMHSVQGEHLASEIDAIVRASTLGYALLDLRPESTENSPELVTRSWNPRPLAEILVQRLCKSFNTHGMRNGDPLYAVDLGVQSTWVDLQALTPHSQLDEQSANNLSIVCPLSFTPSARTHKAVVINGQHRLAAASQTITNLELALSKVQKQLDDKAGSADQLKKLEVQKKQLLAQFHVFRFWLVRVIDLGAHTLFVYTWLAFAHTLLL